MKRFFHNITLATIFAFFMPALASAIQPGQVTVEAGPRQSAVIVLPDQLHSTGGDALLDELSQPSLTLLEDLVRKSSPHEPVKGYATYYAKRFEGRRTTSGYRYQPDKMTAAHVSLPLGTVVRVVNPVTSQEVHVTINDRCAPRSYNLIDLSRAAAKKIGLWGKGRIKVVIIPLLEEALEEPA
jgi:3D (Asp-Asp-Asp) domain-containing protein